MHQPVLFLVGLGRHCDVIEGAETWLEGHAQEQQLWSAQHTALHHSTGCSSPAKMRGLVSLTLLLLALTLSAEAGRGKLKGHKGKPDRSKPASECTPAETVYGKCVPEQGECGEGLREVTCKDQTNKIHCKIPCNWKKDISDCKYKFGPWGACDPATNTKTRSGSLKKVLFNAECLDKVTVSKPCSPKVKKTRGEKKST